MLRKIGFILLGFIIPAVCAFSDNGSLDKVYVQLEDLAFDSGGIWFKNPIDSVRVGAEALHVDSNGYYVSKKEKSSLCPHCGYVNNGEYPGFWGCWNCGFPFR